MIANLGTGWTKKLSAAINVFEFEVGDVEKKAHRDPLIAERGKPPQLSSYAGGPVQKMARTTGPLTAGEIIVENSKRLGIDLLRNPFQRKNSDILKFTNAFLALAVKRPGMSIRRVENLLQAVVRNPILKQQYGSNSADAAEAKGFNRFLFGTGQMFKAIKARVKRRGK